MRGSKKDVAGLYEQCWQNYIELKREELLTDPFTDVIIYNEPIWCRLDVFSMDKRSCIFVRTALFVEDGFNRQWDTRKAALERICGEVKRDLKPVECSEQKSVIRSLPDDHGFFFDITITPRVFSIRSSSVAGRPIPTRLTKSQFESIYTAACNILV